MMKKLMARIRDQKCVFGGFDRFWFRNQREEEESRGKERGNERFVLWSRSEI